MWDFTQVSFKESGPVLCSFPLLPSWNEHMMTRARVTILSHEKIH